MTSALSLDDVSAFLNDVSTSVGGDCPHVACALRSQSQRDCISAANMREVGQGRRKQRKKSNGKWESRTMADETSSLEPCTGHTHGHATSRINKCSGVTTEEERDQTRVASSALGSGGRRGASFPRRLDGLTRGWFPTWLRRRTSSASVSAFGCRTRPAPRSS